MRKLIITTAVFAGLGMTSCYKCDCTARTADGEALYEVTGQKTCKEQLVNAGDYCNCDC